MTKYPSPADIAEMIARGYDPFVVSEARERGRHWQAADDVCQRIMSAFAGVTLGNGVGLRQAQGLDDYEDEATCLAYRELDEKQDWTRMSSAELNHCHSSLSFFDAEGMRFHLPAYLIAELKGDYKFGMAFTLSHMTAWNEQRFGLLDSKQREVVKAVVLLMLEDEEYQYDRPQLQQALEYWSR